jgi:CHAD domain-containing protein
MGYQLHERETVPQGIKRIATEELDGAIHQLTVSINGNRKRAVHQARKHFKKSRAVVRLIRDELGETNYKQENHCFRDAGRQLSDLRDAYVRIETLDKLTEHYQEFLDANAFADLRQLLVQSYESTREQVRDQDAIAEIVSTLHTAKQRVEDWQIRDDWVALASGLQRVYRRGYDAMFQACETPTAENMHEWRKRVKYLWYHLRILTPMWSQPLDTLTNQLKQLADDLGDDHDLAVLCDFLLNPCDRAADANSELGLLLALIQRRQLELQTHARFIGQRLYAESPSAFVERLGVYWRAWQEEMNQPAIALPDASEFIHDLPTANLS